MSTFHGLEMARQALSTQQSALYTTGHNIANANTEGYSRQRVNFETLSPYPSASRNRPEIPGQMGTGVTAGSVQRVRDQFLDNQYRSENSTSSYWSTRSEALSRMENILNEPSESGLSTTVDQFWQSLQDLAVNPENSGARSVVLQRGQALAETFNYMSESLTNIRTDLKSQIDTTVKNANTLIDGINEINQQVKHLETHGYSANDLYDRRDMMIDQLSEIVSINVDYDTSHMPPNKTGDGVVSINIVNESGTELTQLIDGVAGTAKYFDEPGKTTGNYTEENGLEVISGITLEGEAVDIRATEGSLKGLIDAYGYADGEDTAAGDYPEMISKLDDMAYAMATAFNEVHGDPPFFEVDEQTGAAGSISVAITEGSEINASSDGGSGNGENALALAAVFNAENDVLDGASVKSFYESVIGDLGVTAEHANKMTSNTGTLLAQVENQRLSVSAVSLDEEMSNMIKFQHAYSAAARSMTTMDELLDKIINNMGLVGR
ncbi:flagellar hook-associated protein FlgK [Oceanobacillus massiliensis]|uniref:flagellar hook-associated protein FlgK n=2 Tax=Oceanobacillus massiliensis TaxID=1465765 RepID=UPI000288EFFB|nr:flagellar hook-associated protein FlgK [Oceanobacillus massiliensis]